LKFVVEKRDGCRAIVNGKNVTIFSSNDYLGLSSHPEVIKAASEAAMQYGAGTGGAPTTTGTTILHEKLEQAIARFKSREHGVVFASGYQSNQAIHHALDSERTVFHLENRHHPSALDGARLARKSKVMHFEHHKLGKLEESLLQNDGLTNVVSLPSVFTVDGDIAPLDKLETLKRKHGFILILDEAHATGCLGKTGRGLEEHFSLKGAADFIMGTFSKALGSQGGFLVYNRNVESHLRTPFRAWEYSTSLSAVSAGAALKALEILETDAAIIESLFVAKKLIIDECQKNGIPIIAKESMVILLLCKDSEIMQRRLFDEGYLTIAVRAMVNGEIKSCLRITPMATHSHDDIVKFVKAVKANLST
jgi:7-keto-8-aminopelargonate synthetase-like enzyme